VPIVEELIAPRLIGRNVLDRQGLVDGVANELKAAGQRGLLLQALSGVDIAVWDVVGKVLGQPVHRLLGGSPAKEVPVYATGLYYRKTDSLSELSRLRTDEALGLCELGVQGIKMKIGLLSAGDDLRQVETIKNAVGDGVDLMVDANQAYDRPTARRVARSLADLGVLWFEEPIANEDLDGLRELRLGSDVAIAGGETDSSAAAFQAIARANALDIVQPDICMAGGYTELSRIFHLAEAAHLGVCLHFWGSGVSLGASLQMAAVQSSATKVRSSRLESPQLEFDQTPNPLRESLTPNCLELADGKLAVSDAPGIGVDIDLKAIERFAG